MAKISFRTTRETAKISATVRDRADIDSIAERAGYTSHLMNLHLARPLDLTEFKIGNGVYVPVMISARSGGRKSMLDLRTGEQIVVGALICEQGIILRHVQRRKGGSGLLAPGDVMIETWRTLKGSAVMAFNVTITEVDAERGRVLGNGTGTGTGTAGRPKTASFECNNFSCCFKMTSSS